MATTEVLRSPVAVERDLNEEKITFLVEPTTKGFVHACTPDDVLKLLGHLPDNNVEGIELIILRQPTRKEVKMSPVWGRLGYYADAKPYEGTAIILEAQQPGEVVRWSKSVTPDFRRELQRLEELGHSLEETHREYRSMLTAENIRTTQLYGTVPHEVGHYVDWLINMVLPCANTDDEQEQQRLLSAYNSKTQADKEAYAHGYGDDVRASLTGEGVIPFDRMLDEGSLREARLDPKWFLLPE